MMKVLLVDDEELALERMRRLLAAFEDLELLGEAHDGEEAIQKIVELEPEVVFLDIDMPGASGLEVVRSLPAPRPRIVFCTGYDQYAVQAFELHALDYVMKPVTRARLAQTIEHLRQAPAAEWDSALEKVERGGQLGGQRLLVRDGARYRVVTHEEVEYFSSDDGTSSLHTAAGRFGLEPTLNALEARLDPGQFFRVSRSAIVRLENVLEVVPLVGGYGEVQLRSGVRLPVSRRRFRELLARLEGPRPEPAR